MKLLKIISAVVVLALGATSDSAMAYDWWVQGHVVQVEASYLPNTVDFILDTPAGNCAAGQMLFWNTSGPDVATKAANAQGVLSLLISAKLSGHEISIGGFNSGCTIQYIWMD